jgi:hypothetical protein
MHETPLWQSPLDAETFVRTLGYSPYAEWEYEADRRLRRHFGVPDDVFLHGDGLQAFITEAGIDLQDWAEGEAGATRYVHILLPCTVEEGYRQLVHQQFGSWEDTAADRDEFLQAYRDTEIQRTRRLLAAVFGFGRTMSAESIEEVHEP